MSKRSVSQSMFGRENPAVLFLGPLLLFVSCEDKFMKQTTADKTAAIATLQTKLDDSGNHVASFDPTKSETQLMRITSGAIAGAAVAIPPAALSIPVSIAVGEGVSLATSSFSQTLGITDNKINAGGPSVSFTASQDVVATNPMTLSIPFGPTTLNLNDVDTDNIIVMYRWTTIENGATKFEAGILPGENVTRAKNKVSFQTTKFGTFQVGVAEKKITTAVATKTEEPPALKSCERYAAEVFPNCTTHGQVGCLATDAFRAVDMTFLKADFVISGIFIQDLQGNVIVPDSSKVRTGNLYGPSTNQIAGTFALTSDNPALKACERYAAAVYPACVKDGQVGCVTSLGFKAADMALIKPETILAGRVIAGVAGTVTLPSKDKVLSGTTYGPAGATIAGTSFADKPTVSYAGTTGTKIKLGQTMSVSPTSLTSNGSNITACNTKSGTATLPAGLSINPTTCVISGTPTQIVLPATYTIVATNAIGNSIDADVTLAVLDTTAAPKFSLTSGTYGPSTLISLSSSTPGASIYYTTDGSSPTTNSVLYSTPVILSSTLTLRAVATKNNFFDSVESAASYTVDATPPSNPIVVINNGTNYTATATVDLAFSAADASQLYLTNLPGCTTGGNWETFVTSKTWTLGQTNSTAGVYVKYKDTLGNETACVSDTIIHDTIVPLIPVIADPAKSFYTSFVTSIQQNAPTDINFKEFRYTFNNIDPTCLSGAASSAQPTNVTIPAATTTLKVITCDNAGLASPVQAVTYTYSRIAPTVVISAPTMTNANSIPVTITFSSSVTGFDINDIIVDNGNVGSFSGSGTTYSASITPTSQGTVTISVAENSAQDAYNNANIAASPVSVIYDSTSPTVEITSQSISGPTNTPSVMLTFTFSEPVTGFDSTDVLLTNATAGSFTAISATVYTLQINATGLNVTAAIAARAANDSAGNGNMESSQWSVIYDNTLPTVAITSNRDPGPTNNSEITLTFTFSEGVTGFTASDVALTNATAGIFTATSSTVYTLAINPTGTAVSASVPANSATDQALNGSIAGTPWSITYDNSLPTVAITSSPASGPTNKSQITLTFTFSEAVTGFNASDVSVTNATKGTFTATSSTVYTLAISPTGTAVSASVPANSATDSASNGNIASTPWSITYDITPPNAPTVTGTTPIANTTAPTWSWTSGGGGGNGTYRYKLNNDDLTTGASQTTNTSFTQTTTLSTGSHTLYVQERDEAGNWSASGSFVIQLVTIPAAPALAAPTRYNSSLGLSWASVTDATAYNLYWSNNPGVTTASNKIPNVSSVFTHTNLIGGRTYYYKLAAVNVSIEGPLSNEVSAATYSYPAPAVTGISPSSGSTNGGTPVTITGSGFVSGATVSIGGTMLPNVTISPPNSLTAITPAGSLGTLTVVVTNPDGQFGTLASGYSYINTTTAACVSDCYREGSSPNFAQDLPIGSERQGPSGTTLTLQFANGSSGFKIWKEKNGNRILNASGLISNRWQQTLTRPGTAFSGSDMANASFISQIAGRACPTNVFLDHSNMNATNRCLYYDAGNASQTLYVASGNEASDWLQQWDSTGTGRGTNSSHYEGNIKTCADKGMRLPTMYETTMNNPNSNLPAGDTGLNLTGVVSTNGVPSFSSSSWTASASNSSTNSYWTWSSTAGNSTTYTSTASVRCVLPNNSLSSWSDVTVGSDITMRDNTTGLWWSRDRGSMNWSNASSHCGSLNYNGTTMGWRVPTKDELLAAYYSRIYEQVKTGWINNFDVSYWSSDFPSTGTAWFVNLSTGLADSQFTITSNLAQVVCVRLN